MSNRVKYPLTPEAKEAARRLVEAWDTAVIPQYFQMSQSTVPFTKRDYSTNVDTDFGFPPIDILIELSHFRLISADGETLTYTGDGEVFQGTFYTRRWHFLLMQELRNAVANDFEVSDYFLTFNAVGTIITGNATINAPFQSGAAIYGDVSQQISNSDLADKLIEILGQDVVLANRGLAETIQELKTSIESERQSKLGNVISQLGNGIQHIANTAVVVQALFFLAQVLR